MPNDDQSPRDDPQFAGAGEAGFFTEDLARMHPIVHRLLAVWFIAVAVLAIVTIVQIWPTETTPKNNQQRVGEGTTVSGDTLAKVDSARLTIAQAKTALSPDQKYLLVALLFGILGGTTHGLASLMDFRGQRRLFRSWALWYFALPFLGGMLAMIFYVALRAGLLTGAGDNAAGVISIYGIAAISAIVGLFTDRATNKLKEVIDTLLTTRVKRGDELTEGSTSSEPPKAPGT